MSASSWATVVEGVVRDFIRAYEYAPLGLHGVADSHERDADKLEGIDPEAAAAYRQIAERLREVTMPETLKRLIEVCGIYAANHGLPVLAPSTGKLSTAAWICDVVRHAEDHSDLMAAEAVMEADAAFANEMSN